MCGPFVFTVAEQYSILWKYNDLFSHCIFSLNTWENLSVLSSLYKTTEIFSGNLGLDSLVRIISNV